MRFSIQLTPEDCIAARWVALRPRRSLQITGCVVLALIVMVLGWQVIARLRGTPFQTGFWGVLAGIAYLGLLFFVLLPWRVRKIFRQQKTLQRPFEVELGESHFGGSSEHGSFSIPWSDLHKWKIGKKCLLIYQSEAIMHLIPCRAVGSDADRAAIIRLLTAKLGPQRP